MVDFLGKARALIVVGDLDQVLLVFGALGQEQVFPGVDHQNCKLEEALQDLDKVLAGGLRSVFFGKNLQELGSG